jgi:hypothetical protein
MEYFARAIAYSVPARAIEYFELVEVKAYSVPLLAKKYFELAEPKGCFALALVTDYSEVKEPVSEPVDELGSAQEQA